MYWEHFSKLRVSSNQQADLLPRYNLTNDIVGFRRCPRQYGFFNVRGYVPSHTIQLFYGSIIHQVLDKLHHHYGGYEEITLKGKVPTDGDVDNYFIQVENSLRMQGVRPFNPELRNKALRLIKKFNKIEGPTLYPRIVDTEHRLEGRRERYILEGVVDVLVDPSSVSGSSSSTKEGPLEIWDYKGTKFPTGNKGDLKLYEYQMQVYAALYKFRNKIYPKKAVLYFLNELDNDKITSRPKNSVYEVDISKKDVEGALKEFDHTASAIQKCKETDRWDAPSSAKELAQIKDTCVLCDLRWSCSSYSNLKKLKMVYP